MTETVTKTVRKATKLAAGVAALALAGGLLSGCEAKPGAAAYGDGWVVTEQQIGAVNAELLANQIGASGPEQRWNALQTLMVLEQGGREVLSSCPKLEDISTELYQINADNLSQDAKDVMQLQLCATAADPQAAQELGVPALDSQVAEQLDGIFQKVSKEVQEAKFSNRIKQGLVLMQQRQQQQMMQQMTQLQAGQQ